MKILGLDASLNCTGYAIYDTDKNDIVLVDKIHTRIKNATPTLGRRIEAIVTHLSHVMFWHAVDIVVIEDIYVGNNANAAIPLGMLRGAILQMVYGMDCGDMLSIATKSMKKNVAGKGNASKEETYEAIKKLYSHNPIVMAALGEELMSKDNLKKNEDMADACGIVHSYVKDPCTAFMI